MNNTVIVAPLFEPVTLAEVYAHLRLDADIGSPATHEHDALLTSLITTSRMEVEEFTRRSLIQQTRRTSTDQFGSGIKLWYPPILRVDSVQYYDSSNVLTDISVADYYLTDDVLPEICFLDTFAFPTLVDRSDAVRVTYVAGYTPANSPTLLQEDYAANVPEPLKNAILLGVELHYEALSPADREALVTTREAMMWPYKVLLTA